MSTPPKALSRTLQTNLLRDQVTDMLRQAIINLELRPGQVIIERELVELTHVSRATVREAIRQLETEGLVATTPQKGSVVTVPSLKEVEELYELRRMLESLLARQFAVRGAADEISGLRRAFDDLRQVVERGGDAREIIFAKDQFYEALFRGSDNVTASYVVRGLKARMALARTVSVSRPGRAETLIDELGEIVNAIECKDADRAEAASRHHIAAASENIYEALLEEGSNYKASDL